jgi:hypothetical protein
MLSEIYGLFLDLYYNVNVTIQRAMAWLIRGTVIFIISSVVINAVFPRWLAMLLLPLLALIPVIGAFRWAIATVDPVLIAILDKKTKAGDQVVKIVWGIFAVELAIGLYFSLVNLAAYPRYTTLVMLLIASMVALGFAPKSKPFPALKRLTTVVFIGLTLCFVLSDLFPKTAAKMPSKLDKLDTAIASDNEPTVRIEVVKDGWKRYDPAMEKEFRLRPQSGYVLFKTSKAQVEPYILDEDGEFWMGQGDEKQQVSRKLLSGLQAFWMKAPNPGQKVDVKWEEIPYH